MERRKYQRYDTEAKVFFRVKYDLKTRISFFLIKPKPDNVKKYEGITHNISAEGLRFSSPERLKIGDELYLELFLPHRSEPICMTGQVRWSQKFSSAAPEKCTYDTGVRLLTVGGAKVSDTIRLDQEYNVYWSAALDAVFSNFKGMIKEIKEKQ